MSACAPQNIDDLLADPLIRKVMRADRVETGSLRGMLGRVAVRLAANRPARPAPSAWRSPSQVCEAQDCC